MRSNLLIRPHPGVHPEISSMSYIITCMLAQQMLGLTAAAMYTSLCGHTRGSLPRQPPHSSQYPEMAQKLSGIQSSLMSTKREVVRLRQLAARQGLFDDPAAALAQASAAIKRELGLLTQAVRVSTHTPCLWRGPACPTRPPLALGRPPPSPPLPAPSDCPDGPSPATTRQQRSQKQTLGERSG